MELVFALDLLVAFVGVSGKFRETFSSQFFKAAGLREERGSQPLGHFAFADNASERGDGIGTASKTDVRVLALREDVRRDDAPGVCGGQFDKLCFAWGLFVEHGFERRFLDDLDEKRVLRTVEFGFDFLLGKMAEVEWPDADLGDLKGIKDVHSNGVGALVGEMPPDAGAEPLVSLPNVDRLTVVIIEGIDAALGAADALTLGVELPKEGLNFAPDCRDISGLAFRRWWDVCGLSGQSRSGWRGVVCGLLGLGHGEQ